MVGVTGSAMLPCCARVSSFDKLRMRLRDAASRRLLSMRKL
jgi:hypothetical protein